ncbi:peptidoglycan/LPS O-acetylase OafA/YrhL [Brevundimonas alba]|uniref:Peptidoglycan/LPS O-acetylase OafA/YrhL n=1 Tax=Brevundimonas alba TaxID=74314 RepID=A0A7X6BMN0_9CAUL|nr:hypothetical protein [Brevundimonas alba]NJC40537.1 peptidoglycan/LPS O-acetylase OafA/YrhL [Brevundimonas alba]
MTPFQTAALVATLLTLLIAWFRGGHPERFGAAVVLVWLAAQLLAVAGVIPFPLTRFEVAYVPVYDTLVESALLAAFVFMAMKGSRWWPFAAAAVMVLGVLIYVALPFVPHLRGRPQISAHLGLVLALDLSLLAGVGERWLAGEPAASRLAIWRSSAQERSAP